MDGLTHNEVVTFLLALGILLGAARFAGELMTRFHQPAVVGEFLAGIVLGPTVFGTFAPSLHDSLFPATGGFPLALDGLTRVAIVLFLVVAGLEVDLTAIRRQGRIAASVSVLGMAVPFALGLIAAWILPGISAESAEQHKLLFALFFATALSISALPVIAKILMDLGLFRSDVGMVVITAAIIDDLTGWLIFAFLLSLLRSGHTQFGVGSTLLLLTLFTGVLLSVGRKAVDRALAWIQAHSSWPGGVLGFTLSAAFLCAAFTEWIGIHGVFGGFLFGVALGDSKNLRGRTRRTLEQFISYIFAPLFFASVGLKVNFATNFDLPLVALVLALATLGKVGGCWAGARLAGMGRQESWAVGFALNARGAMEIILGLLALEAGLIGERMFVALVVMALVTSITSGTAMRYILGLRKQRRFFEFMPAKAFVPEIAAMDRRAAIFELAETLTPFAEGTSLGIGEEVWQRELIMSTSLGAGVAVPHARLAGLKAPLVALGLSRAGLDFDSPDGDPSRVICLVVTPQEDPVSEVHLLADVARTFQRRGALDRVLHAKTSTDLLAFLNTVEQRTR